MRLQQLTLIALLLLLFGQRAWSQAEASARFDSFSVETGEAFVLHLKVTGANEPGSVDFSAWDTLIPKENRLEETAWTSLGANVWSKDYTLIAFDSATLELPPLVVQFRGGDTAMTNPLQIDIEPTIAPDELSNMADIKDIRHEPLWWSDWWWLYVALGLMALLVLLRRFLKFRKTKTVSSRKIELPADEMALKKLAALEQKQHWQNGRYKTYYDELSHIAREYTEKRFGVPALESTSSETLHNLRSTDFPVDQLPGLAELLQVADLVKFAKGTAPETYHTRAFDVVLELVRSTRIVSPKPQAAP